jgi:hypothetical protein
MRAKFPWMLHFVRIISQSFVISPPSSCQIEWPSRTVFKLTCGTMGGKPRGQVGEGTVLTQSCAAPTKDVKSQKGFI